MYGGMVTAAIQCMHTNVGHDWGVWVRKGVEKRGRGRGGDGEREGWGGGEGEGEREGSG